MTHRFAASGAGHAPARTMLADRARVVADALSSSLWPVPLAMVALAVVAWWGATWLDGVLPPQAVLGRWWLRSGSGDDARNLLSTLVTAIITISSIVFSITIVTLTLAANQFGSRLVRIYMSDLWSKLALGLFVMTVMYCLLALRVIEKDMAPEQVPHVTVTLGLALAAACVLVLVVFLHNVARTIIADEVIRRVGRDLEQAIGSLEDGARETEAGSARETEGPGSARGAAVLRSAEEGYVQAVRYEALLQAAQRHDAVVDLTFRPGVFMCRDGWLARVHPACGLDGELSARIHEAVLIGRSRTPTQDLEFSMRHLIDVALRALSPGINDANTAMVVIDRLRGALSTLMGKRLRPGVYRDAEGHTRVRAPTHSYADILEYAFAQIRRSAAPQPAVILRLLAAIGRIAEHARLPEQTAALKAQAQLAADEALACAATANDRQSIELQLAATLRKVDAVAAG
jgi:uncharacterized membrane protein